MPLASCFADLHMHSLRSDGTLSPEALMQLAATNGLQVVALTDHDTTAGWGAAREAASEAGIHIVPGVELSVTVDGAEVHLLGYGFDPNNPSLQRHLRAFMKARSERARAMVRQLQAEGIGIAMEDVHAESREAQALGRPHVAAALVARGAVETVDEAFQRYIGEGGPAFVPKPSVPAHDVMSLLHDAGGIGVLAHPGNWTPMLRIRRLLDAGLDGIEVIHPSHKPYLQTYYSDLAQRHELLATGGSDFHGRSGDDERIGRVGLSEPQWERVRAALA
jgi:predicted metal-dependent phosphoesterase TrpH